VDSGKGLIAQHFAAAKRCGIEMLFEHRLVGLVPQGDRVELEFQTPGGTRRHQRVPVPGDRRSVSAVQQPAGSMWLGSTRDTAAALGDMPASLWSGKWCFARQKMSPPELRNRGAGGVATKYGGPLAVSIQYPPRPVAAFRRHCRP
jgi:hypothetical protein